MTGAMGGSRVVFDSAAIGRDDERGVTAWEVHMDEILTVEQIEARFAPDWVLIGEPQTDDEPAVGESPLPRSGS